MGDLIKLVRTYRVTAGLAERIRLAEDIFRMIGPDLHLFVFSAVPHHTAEDNTPDSKQSSASDTGEQILYRNGEDS
jgi:hypothetical protein